MNTSEIIKEIKRLPISKRFYVVEKTMRSIRTEEKKDRMKKAADLLNNEYISNKELLAFTNLDLE